MRGWWTKAALLVLALSPFAASGDSTGGPIIVTPEIDGSAIT